MNTTTQEDMRMSTKRQFCPGDWRVEARDDAWQTIRPAYEIVVDVDGETGWLADVGTNPDDADADAQVMAASKALYLALQACLPVAERAAFAAVERTDRDVAWLAAEAARAALALVERRV